MLWKLIASFWLEIGSPIALCPYFFLVISCNYVFFTSCSQAIITSMTPVNGSNAGGTVITFIGNGFMSDDLSVSLSSRSCDVKKDSVTNFQVRY